MALFSRRKNAEEQSPEVSADSNVAPVDAEEQEAAVAADVASEVAGNVPQVGISVSAFGGLGAPSKPLNEQLPAEGEPIAPVNPFNEDGSVRLPFAAPVPPENWRTVEELVDNAVLRDALARLPEDPSGPEVLGVARQALGGHLFLRVQGDARELVEQGKPLSLGIVRDGDRSFLMAFSSGEALRLAIEADNDVQTSAVGQPARQVFEHLLENDFAGIVLDNWSGQARVVLPRDLVERMMQEADESFNLKTLIAGPRNDDTAASVAEALLTSKLWVAVGRAVDANGEEQFGVAEARTPEGERFLQLFSHPLEVVALGRDERPGPFTVEQLQAALRDNEGIHGVLIDPAGPLIRLSREELAPLLAE